MKKMIASIVMIVMLASCAAGHKKVIILSQGTANVDTDNRKITTAGKGHEELQVKFHDEGKVELQIVSQAGNATVQLNDNGVYIINTKSDTIVGSMVAYTAPKTSVEKISEAQLRADIDSLEQIINGKISATKKTFFILPNSAVKISDNTEAHIITPYRQMTSMEVKKGETPEVYRFYPISEARATLLKLKGFLGEGSTPVND